MKKTSIFLLSVLLVLMLCVGVNAATSALWDNAGLLNQSQKSSVEAALSQTAEHLDMDVVITTVRSLEGKSSRRYAEDFYDDYGYAGTGVLLLVCMAEREYWVTTTGAISVDLETLEESFVPLLSAGDYEGAFLAFADYLPLCLTVEAEEDLFGTVLFISVIIGLVAALITTLVMKSRLKSVRAQRCANSYVRSGSFQLMHSRDIYLYRNVRRTPKPKNNGPSSSGRSHGGGGGKF